LEWLCAMVANCIRTAATKPRGARSYQWPLFLLDASHSSIIQSSYQV
jgi:hypothetical protein